MTQSQAYSVLLIGALLNVEVCIIIALHSATEEEICHLHDEKLSSAHTVRTLKD